MDFTNDAQNFDQHFLIDEKVINKFIDVANILSSDEIVEVGPGSGVLTKLIAPKAKKLTCIELDERLKPQLEILKEKYPNIELIFANILDSYIPKCNKIITSLPYRIIEPFIGKLLKCEFQELFMIVGSNFADSILNKEITKLAIITNCFFKTTKYIDILPNSFNPSPRVKSTLIRLQPISYNQLDDNYLLFRLMFNFRTKKVKNNLVESLIKYYQLKGLLLTKNESKKIINDLNINNNILNKTFESCSNEELKEIALTIEQIIKIN